MAKKSAIPVASPPQSRVFGDVIGHERVISYLRQAQARNRLPQAILFDGPSGIGKSAMAYCLAKFLLAGGDKKKKAFGVHAGKVERESHPDLRVLAPSGAGGQIKVDTVRDALDTALQMPLEGERKVFIIDPADRLNPSSANSLLKLVEEPPPLLTIILATESVHSILPTIRSRAARLRLLPLDEKAIAEWLAGEFGADPSEARAATLFSAGCPGQAVAQLGGQSLVDRDVLIAEWKFFQQYGFLAMFRVAHNMSSLDQSTEGLVGALIAWVRDVIVTATAPGKPELVVNRDRIDDLNEEAQRLGPRVLGCCLEILLETRADARRLINKQLFFENLLIRLGPELKKS